MIRGGGGIREIPHTFCSCRKSIMRHSARSSRLLCPLLNKKLVNEETLEGRCTYLVMRAPSQIRSSCPQVPAINVS